jgi:hypothetical protein
MDVVMALCHLTLRVSARIHLDPIVQWAAMEDLESLLDLYFASDCFIHLGGIGEDFGIAAAVLSISLGPSSGWCSSDQSFPQSLTPRTNH